MRTAIFTVLISLLTLNSSELYGGYGDQVNGFPNQKERELHLATNLVRTAPQQFRDLYIGNYNILLESNYPAVPPIYLDHDLTQAARAHALDMAANCGLSHNSCDGTLWSTRIKSYYSKSGWIAENIATGRSSGFATVVQFLRDDLNGTSTPAPDNSSGDGHRKNIMNGNYQDFGPGYDYSSTRRWYHFWVQDFGGGPHDYYAIASGFHLYLDPGQISFMATFYDPSGNSPQSAQVIINGVPHTMSHHLGSVSMGSYQLSLDDNDDCRDYYFQITDSGGRVWRYPETEVLSNNPVQSCYNLPTLADAIVNLQVITNSRAEESAVEKGVDYNGDGKLGLEDTIHILRQLSTQ